MKTPTDPFFAEPADVKVAARALSLEIASRLFVWMSDAPTLHERGVRATVALYCVRPDLIAEPTLEEIGQKAGRSRQAVHHLANDFRETTGLRS
jgi:hypothetical protein